MAWVGHRCDVWTGGTYRVWHGWDIGVMYGLVGHRDL